MAARTRVIAMLVIAAVAAIGVVSLVGSPDRGASTTSVGKAVPTQSLLPPVHPASPRDTLTRTAVTAASDKVSAEDSEKILKARRLIIPVAGVKRAALVDTFAEGRGAKSHDAIDIMAPRGTPVVAVDDGRVAKLYRSVAGGITIYQFDTDETFVYYYAHLDGYASGLHEGRMLQRGEVIGFVGSTGNAASDAPHLHFAIFHLSPEKKWWKGKTINPFPYLNDAAR